MQSLTHESTRRLYDLTVQTLDDIYDLLDGVQKAKLLPQLNALESLMSELCNTPTHRDNVTHNDAVRIIEQLDELRARCKPSAR